MNNGSLLIVLILAVLPRKSYPLPR